MLPAMVLAAGLGTRLRPLTEGRAKPLVPVGDEPALGHVLGRLRAAGAPFAVVNAYHLSEQVAAFARALPWDVRVSEEPELLGTAGGLHRAGGLLGDGDVLVWNGDILAEVDPRALVAAHAACATLVVAPGAAGQGPVGLDAQGRVVRLRDQRFGEEAQGGQFLGIYVLSAGLRRLLPARGGLVEDVLIPAMARGEVVRAFPFAGAWHDIGTLPAYLAANQAWLAARGLAAWTGPGAQIDARVTLERSVVGAGAVIEGSGALRGCVVWPGARARAPRQEAVITS